MELWWFGNHILRECIKTHICAKIIEKLTDRKAFFLTVSFFGAKGAIMGIMCKNSVCFI